MSNEEEAIGIMGFLDQCQTELPSLSHFEPIGYGSKRKKAPLWHAAAGKD
ncbi:hypothetical protein CaCOL14_001143 [Colletotrichum acutatum]